MGGALVSPHIQFDAAYASPAKRAMRTGELAFGAAGINLPILPREGLLELSQGLWEGKPRGQALPLDDFTELAELHPGQTIAVFGHAIAARAAAMIMTDNFDIINLKIPFCSEPFFVCRGSKWRPSYMGMQLIDWDEDRQEAWPVPH